MTEDTWQALVSANMVVNSTSIGMVSGINTRERARDQEHSASSCCSASACLGESLQQDPIDKSCFCDDCEG